MTDTTPTPALRDALAAWLLDHALDDPAEQAALDSLCGVVQPFVATAPELEARQRWAWSRLGLCPRCGHEDGKGRLCGACDGEVRRLPALLRRPWRRFRPLPTGQPIQGHGYTPAGLLGMDCDTALTPPADQPDTGGGR